MTRALLGAVALALLAGCAGPAPEVESVRTEPSPRPQHVLVTVALRNASGGDGQVEVRVTLRERVSGRVVGQETFEVELLPHGRVAVTREIPVAATGEVTAEARAGYPPE